MTQVSRECVSERCLVEALLNAKNFPIDRDASVEMHETHISRVFLVGEYAYKVKKPIRNDFLDYSSPAKRKFYALEELRLDRRYAPDLYLAVVPITLSGERIQVEGNGVPIDYAVKMRRFPSNALLSNRLARSAVSPNEVKQLAEELARFHLETSVADPFSELGDPKQIEQDAMDNFGALSTLRCSQRAMRQLEELRNWTQGEFVELEASFRERKEAGFIRECHGDLHAGNIVRWRDNWQPFDGIEFNDRFRWIDILSDAGFLAMDIEVREHPKLAHLFVNSYMEVTGDYESLRILRWYSVYRAMVRAKVAFMRGSQLDAVDVNEADRWTELEHLVDQAYQFTETVRPKLWITHGLSGSGKSTGAERYVQEHNAIRLRADVERKRLHGLKAADRPTGCEREQVYSSTSTNRAYCRLRELARAILLANYSVVVDATFLRQEYRDAFSELANDLGVEFQILDFTAPESVLRARVAGRQGNSDDASDAGLAVLEAQIQHCEPLSASEQRQALHVVNS